MTTKLPFPIGTRVLYNSGVSRRAFVLDNSTPEIASLRLIDGPFPTTYQSLEDIKTSWDNVVALELLSSQTVAEVDSHQTFQLRQLQFKLKTACLKKERTAQRLQQAWDADNEAAKCVTALEVQLTALGGREALK